MHIILLITDRPVKHGIGKPYVTPFCEWVLKLSELKTDKKDTTDKKKLCHDLKGIDFNRL